MSILFLESLSLDASALLAFGLAMFAVFAVISIAFYIYFSLTYKAIGKKANLNSPNLAWIPGVGPLIIAYQASKMHWWPWLLLLSLLIGVIPIIGLIMIIPMLVFIVFVYIWHWKMFEAIGKPGWWILISLIPFIGGIIYLVFLGIAAWGGEGSIEKTQTQ